MGIVNGGTIEDLANAEISVCFSFEPRGTRKSLEDIYSQRSTSKELKPLIKKEVERMVKKKYMLIEGKETYVFSRDTENKYYWKKAAAADQYLNYFLNVEERFRKFIQ